MNFDSSQKGENLFRGEEQIVGGIGHTHFLGSMRFIAAGCGRFAAFGVEALDGRDTRENAFASAADNRDKQPGNGTHVG